MLQMAKSGQKLQYCIHGKLNKILQKESFDKPCNQFYLYNRIFVPGSRANLAAQ